MKNPILVGHRGCNYEGINQNTMRSFHRVYAEGCRGIEFDIIPSKDKKLFVVHNLLLDEVSTGYGPVMEADASEIEQLYAGNISQGKDRIPTLADVYRWMSTLPRDDRPVLQVELKGTGAGEGVGQLTREYLDRQELDLENLLVISFSRDELSVFRQICSDVNVAILGGCAYRNVFLEKVPCLSPDHYNLLFAYHSEAFMLPKYQDFSEYEGVITPELIPDDGQRMVATKIIASIFDGSCYDDSFFEFAKKLNAYSVNLWHKNLNKNIVDKVHALGFKVCVYTVDDEKDFLRMREIGVDAVVTNFYLKGKHVYDK